MPARKRTPSYPLEEVKRVIRLARIGDRVLARTRCDCGEDDLSRVRALICRLVGSLAPGDFVYSEEQIYAVVLYADIYALTNRTGNWFIKFYMEHGRVTVASCHALERDITRADGKIIKV